MTSRSALDLLDAVHRSGLGISQFHLAAQQLSEHKSWLEQSLAELLLGTCSPPSAMLCALPSVNSSPISQFTVLEHLFEYAMRSSGFQWASFYEGGGALLLYPFEGEGWEGEDHPVCRAEQRLLQLVARAARCGMVAELVRLFEVGVRAIKRYQLRLRHSVSNP
jgi:hypothetical protein